MNFVPLESALPNNLEGFYRPTFKNVVAANSLLFMGYSRVGVWEYLYNIIVLFIARSAGLGSCRRREALDIWAAACKAESLVSSGG